MFLCIYVCDLDWIIILCFIYLDSFIMEKIGGTGGTGPVWKIAF
jgi:hypothetical protein